MATEPRMRTELPLPLSMLTKRSINTLLSSTDMEAIWPPTIYLYTCMAWLKRFSMKIVLPLKPCSSRSLPSKTNSRKIQGSVTKAAPVHLPAYSQGKPAGSPTLEILGCWQSTTIQSPKSPRTISLNPKLRRQESSATEDKFTETSQTNILRSTRETFPSECTQESYQYHGPLEIST